MKSTTNCPLCKSSRTSAVPGADKSKFNYKSCTNCGLIYVPNIASKKKLYKSYDGGLLKSFRRKILSRFRNFDSFGNFSNFIKKADKITAIVDKNIDKKKQLKLLDIGCNKGFLLHSALQKNWDAYGVELVPELLIPFKKKYTEMENKIFIGGFEDVYKNFEDNYFDVVTAIDVIEHFEDPRESLKNIYNVLSPGGIFVIQTPDSQSDNAKQAGPKWGALKPLEHLFLFNKENYSTLANDVGFSEIKFFKPFEEADGNFVAISKK